MKEKLKIIGGAMLALIVISVVGFYFSMANYYSDKFLCGTWINGIYCTGLTVEEVESRLVSENSAEYFAVTDYAGNTEQICLSDVGYYISYGEELQNIMHTQNPLSWLGSYFTRRTYDVVPVCSVSENALRETVNEMEFMSAMQYDETLRPYIVRTREGYALVDETKHLLCPEEAYHAIYEEIRNHGDSISLNEAGCYRDVPLTDDMQEVYDLWASIEDVQDFRVTYMFGEEEFVIDSSETSSWIMTDENGRFVYDSSGDLMISEEEVAKTVNEMSEIFSTLGGTHRFFTTGGEWIEVSGGTYGNDIDEAAEINNLLTLYRSGMRACRRTPQYEAQGAEPGRDDLGDTYVEVDMGEQKLYYYEEGQLLLETDIVTGNQARGWDTPSVVCYVYSKQRNRILRGATYATFVYYWMPIYGNIGFHDATWRRSFGDDIYTYDGSHGCVNMPKEAAAALYDYVEIGTPVILYN
ncbi:MAG: L,D-transpeptidase family protein [Lachnospiraceae bacterium]|nr:L,D-transpeptidase family protein [Lachnospiraceae bacterium]